MRVIFFLFTLFVLLLAEFIIGTFGIYLPLAWMGFFYFAAAKYNYKLLFLTGILGSMITDTIIYHRLAMPDLFMFSVTMYTVWRYGDILRKSSRIGGLFGISAILSGYILQFAASLTAAGFSWSNFTDTAAVMVTALPFGYFIQMLIIILLDFMQKKMRFESSFVQENKKGNTTIYRRRRFADD